MNSQDYRNLQEAYLDVYQEVDEATAMAKRGYDEVDIRNQIAAKTSASGAGSFADKATALADKPTFGQRGVNPRARQNLARTQRGDFRKTTSSSPGLHGYGHKSNDPEVKAKQAARGAQRSALTPNERKQLNMSYDLYDVILAHLLAEGYADTNENALVIMANMSEDWRDSIVEATIRSVTSSSGKRIYKSPEYSSDERTNISKTRHRQRRERQRKYASTSDARDNQRSFNYNQRQGEMKEKHPTNIMNAKPGYSEYGTDEGPGYHYDTVKTDSNARRRRASGR